MAGGLNAGGGARLLLLLCVAGTSAFLYVKYHHLLTVEALKQNHTYILGLVAENPRLAPCCYIMTLVVVIGLTCPGATMLSFVGGVLFPQPYASAYAYVGYILGASISFFVASFILGDCLQRRLRKSSLWTKFERNVRKNAFVYLVAARYTMVFPFFFVNAAAAIVGVRWRTFAAATSVSCIPGSVVYTAAGGALASLLHQVDGDVDKSQLIWMALADPNVRVCLGALTVVSGCMIVARLMQPNDNDEDGGDAGTTGESSKAE
eukprot:TRINITY_DN54292_c0_g1_i1.p1 TRINITY_DN54292_c0_g1~~TRINITY_DN54292_c0_g1_i1.p1  ORF type:complete len:272 (+),score=48.66 TRINITY_DN54292_c0_g1_i1:29-817(+)